MYTIIGDIISKRNYANGTTDLYYHYDAIGNVAFITDCYGNITVSYVQEGFGNILASSGSLASNNYHLTTKEIDPISGLYYFGARWYDPQIGRWISREPTGIDGPNLYQYSFNNPINMVDPNGLEAIPVYHGPEETNGWIQKEINGVSSGPWSGFWWIWDNNRAGALMDPKGHWNKEEGSQEAYKYHFYCVDGEWQRSDQFGNWVYGFGTGLWELQNGMVIPPLGVLGADYGASFFGALGTATQGDEYHLFGGWPDITKGYLYTYKYYAKKIWSQLP
jgi:RHS repeat-associated protein